MSQQPKYNQTKYKKPADKKICKRCIRIRWLMTALLLSSMLVILYLNEYAQ
jgi:hypothetical protein